MPPTPTSDTYHAEYQRNRYERRRAEAITTLGGHCRCGATDGLEVINTTRGAGRHTFAQVQAFSLARFRAEILGWTLLCTPCRLEVTRAAGEVPPAAVCGTYAMYRHHGCRCVPCTAANAAMAGPAVRRHRARRRAQRAEA